MLYAAAYDKVRLPWQMVNGGPAAASTRRSTAAALDEVGGGLPTGRIGRSDSTSTRRTLKLLRHRREREHQDRWPAAVRPAGRVPVVGGEVYRTEDGGRSWAKMNRDDENVSSGAYYFSQVRVDPNNDKTIFLTGSPGGLSKDGGRTWSRISHGCSGTSARSGSIRRTRIG